MSKETPIHSYKRTKILATVGPSTNSRKSIENLIKNGANGIRLNFSHGTFQERVQQIAWIRSAARTVGKPVAVVQDLQGPKIRFGLLNDEIEVKAGNTISCVYGKEQAEDSDELPIQYDLTQKVKAGDRMLIADGRVHAEVMHVKNGVIKAKIRNDGKFSSRKGINLPDTDLEGDILTKKDREDLRFGQEHDVDYVALSFVQTADDVRLLKKELKKLGSNAKVITKVETKAATQNLEEIVKESDGVMVARGDLATETEPESVPIVQRQIIGLCQKHGKVSIVATQMLASMTDAPSPTRAEVSDVATAVILGTDAVMLSDETASGDFPEDSIKYMKRIIRYTEDNAPVEPRYLIDEDHSIQSSISSAVMTLAHQVQAAAIVAETASGNTARSLASHRPNMPIIMVTHDQQVANQLALVYGGKSYVRAQSRQVGERMTDWLRKNDILAKDDVVVITSGKYPGEIGGTDTIKVRRLS
ncbi:TPA: pyruvate kinase [Candidatus Saccharibacteria bacterium]|nr:pyruvate kinase [Candidatus Saccharibacteria bacterium]HIO88046.1 pyruvate kinase [Candidatus Saccharibacteria bacterium]